MSLDMSNIPSIPDFSGIDDPIARKTIEDVVIKDSMAAAGIDDTTSSTKNGDLDKMLGILSPKDYVSGDSVGQSVVTSNNTSADKAADVANQLTGDWFKDSMLYNAEQAWLDRDFQQSSADKAMKFEADEARIYREWLEMMSNTQYQRAVADLKKAGLNPILLAQGLSGASTPSASSPSGKAVGGSRASISQSSAVKAEVDLNSRARIIEAYLRSETSLAQTEIKSISNLISALIGLGS